MAVPNPNPVTVALDLAGPVDSVTGTLYSAALTRIETMAWGAQSAGWVRLVLPADRGRLANGLYYERFQASYRGTESRTVLVKWVLLK